MPELTLPPRVKSEPSISLQNTLDTGAKACDRAGRKPRYVERFNIEQYLLDGESTRDGPMKITMILSESDVSRYRVIFRFRRGRLASRR